MSQHFSAKDGQLFANLQRAAITLCDLKESYRALAESHRALKESHRILLEEKDETIEEQRQELEANGEKIEKQRQELDDLNCKLDCQPNYCENDGSSNCAMSRSRICSR